MPPIPCGTPKIWLHTYKVSLDEIGDWTPRDCYSDCHAIPFHGLPWHPMDRLLVSGKVVTLTPFQLKEESE